MKVPNTAGPDFIFQVTDNVGNTFVKMVEVKARKSLSLNDLKNYILPGNRMYNINYGVLHKDASFFRRADGTGLPIQFDLYIYGDNSADLAKAIADKLPVNKELPYKYLKQMDETQDIAFIGKAVVNIIAGSL